jgi:glycosyltransferase involved in cell wall biosynthesis
MTDIMRIAHFSNTYKPDINGVARSVSTFREGLSRMGHHVFVFAQEAPHDYEETEPYIFRYPGLHVPQFSYSITVPSSHTFNKILPILKPHVIHSNHPIALGDVAAKRAEKLNLPLVFTFHTNYVEYAEEYTAAYIPWSQNFVVDVIVDGLVRYLDRCHHIVTPSDSVKQGLAEYTGLTDQVTTIPTGIDVVPYQQADGQAIRQQNNWDREKVLVWIGRLAEEKNVKTLLSAVAQVMQQNSAVRLLMVGDGPQGSELKKYAQELGMADKVKFTGRIPFDAVPAHLKAGDIFCFSSITETQGLVTMEAMAAGLPVAAVDATGTSDAVDDGVEGLLTENDSAALGQAIQRMLDDPQLLDQLKSNAIKKAKSFDMMVQTQKMVAVYQQAIADKEANRHVRVDKALLKAKMKEDRRANP